MCLIQLRGFFFFKDPTALLRWGKSSTGNSLVQPSPECCIWICPMFPIIHLSRKLENAKQSHEKCFKWFCVLHTMVAGGRHLAVLFRACSFCRTLYSLVLRFQTQYMGFRSSIFKCTSLQSLSCHDLKPFYIIVHLTEG